MMRKKLSKWAKEQDVHYRTALTWVREGKMPVPIERTPGGHIRVVVDDLDVKVEHRRTVLYARVSSSDQKTDLERQADRLRAFAAGRGIPEVEVITEIGSGLNGRRCKLIRLLEDKTVVCLIVEHRDRLARFGVKYIEAALRAQGREILVLESGERKLDLVQDFIDVVTSMCARIYGRRAAKNRARRALEAAAMDEV
jgi:putative resolvase